LFLAVIGGDPPLAGSGQPRPAVLDALASACAATGVRIRDVVWAAELTRGAAWRCYGGCGCSGTLPDPACSPLAAAVVAAGRVTYADRAELERLVAPADAEAVRRRAALLDRYLDAAADEAAGQTGVEPPGGMASVELLAHLIEVAAKHSPELADEDVVRLCLTLSDPLVRDAAFGFASSDQADGARRLWGALVTGAPDPEAAEPAVLLAHHALVAGEGALASVALERAQRAWPGHRLSAMVQAALAAGVDPEVLCAWLAKGAERAVELLCGGDNRR
jgi:hypothetical protein